MPPEASPKGFDIGTVLAKVLARQPVHLVGHLVSVMAGIRIALAAPRGLC